MPWAGDGNFGDVISNIPRGWILCDGNTFPASRYPLLSSVIGNSYGGEQIGGQFPHFTGTCKVPDISTKAMEDLEPEMLFDSRYQYGQTDAYSVLGNLVADDGLTTSIPTLISADTDLAFLPLPQTPLIGKITSVNVNPPSFQSTVYVTPRKLGINHTPYHNHEGTYNRAVSGAAPPDLFSPSTMTYGGSRSYPNGCGTGTWNEANFVDATNAETWCNGRLPVTYYDENTLITTDKFNQFISSPSQDYTGIPANTAGPRVIDSLIYTDAFTSTPVQTHREPAWEGMFPRPAIVQNRRNYFGYNTNITGATGLQDDPEAVPAKSVFGVTITAGTSTIILPPGTDIGPLYNQIVPFMLVNSSNTVGAYIPPGTQIVGMTLNDSNLYEIELSDTIAGAGFIVTEVLFRHGTYPVCMNTTAAAQDPASASAASHNHATFDITMNLGTLTGPTTHPVSGTSTLFQGQLVNGGVSIGNVAPETITGALNIIANISNPSLNLVYIIRAY